MSEDPRRAIATLEVLLRDPQVSKAVDNYGLPRVKAAIADAQQLARSGRLQPSQVAARAVADLRRVSMQSVLNATGIVVHTNLGRSPLSQAAVAAMTAASGYVDLELELASGGRGSRGAATTAALLARVPAAEAALLVNNGAAALLLAVTALAGGKDIIISRGQLIEIGAGFRLSELMVTLGARLREVGSTNRTHLADYRNALSATTACIVFAHRSNFAMTGFVAETSIAELATLGPPVVADLGSGLLTPNPMLADEPDVTSALTAGASLVIVSGDKLLGGPQAGLILGRAGVVEQLRRHPLARALRVDKVTLAALEASLRSPTPVQQYLAADPDTLRRRCDALSDAVSQACPAEQVEVVAVQGHVGGGGAPEVGLPSWAVSLDERVAAELRTGEPAVLARVRGGRCLIDLRCIEPADDPKLTAAVLAAVRRTAAEDALPPTAVDLDTPPRTAVDPDAPPHVAITEPQRSAAANSAKFGS